MNGNRGVPSDRVTDSSSRPSTVSWHSLRAFLANYVTLTSRSLLQELMFRIHARRQSRPRLRTLIGAFGLLVVLIWPSDFYLFRDRTVLSLFSFWRGFTLLFMGAFWLLVNRLDITREWTIWILVLLLSLYFAVTGHVFGEIRGLSFPWFYIAYMLPMFSIVLGIDLPGRFVASTLVTASFVAAYMSNVPGATAYPDLHQFLPLTGSSIFLFTMIGHSMYHLDRINFFQSRLAKQQRQTVRRLARRDQLTGLYNRREFESRFEDEFVRSRRYARDLSLLMLDLDHFKTVNDAHGHQVGDGVLRTVGNLLQETLRRADIAGRYGGEEFTVVLPETAGEGGRRSARRIQRKLSRESFSTERGDVFGVTCSIGVAELNDEDDTPEQLLRRADRALYAAKERGRNQIVRAPER